MKQRMFKNTLLAALFALGSTYTLASDGSSNSTKDGEILNGIMQLKQVALQFKDNLVEGKDAEIEILGKQLEHNWAIFEDRVKAHYPDYYVKVEASLNPAVAGTEDDELDLEILGVLDDQLLSTLDEFSDKITHS